MRVYTISRPIVPSPKVHLLRFVIRIPLLFYAIFVVTNT